MPMVDPFTPDAFKLLTLTAIINNLDYEPMRLGELGLFEEQGITTLDAVIEEDNGVLALVDVAPRGAPGKVITGSKRKVYSFRVPHLPERASIMADESQSARTLGTGNGAELVRNRIEDRLKAMRRNIDYTIEAHRMAALQGNFYDVNGTLKSLFTEFGVTQTTVTMTLSSATTKVRQVVLDILKSMEDGLAGTPFTTPRALCSDGFWRAFIEHDAVKAAFDRYEQGANLRQDPRAGFEYAGVIWERYRGNTQVAVPANEAIVVPDGVPGLFITRFAPADYNETVNTVGLPYYAKGERIRFDKGWDIEVQSNPINLCTRPASLIRVVAA